MSISNGSLQKSNGIEITITTIEKLCMKYPEYQFYREN